MYSYSCTSISIINAKDNIIQTDLLKMLVCVHDLHDSSTLTFSIFEQIINAFCE